MRSENLLLERPHPAGLGGVQRLYRFPNGLGASVVRTAWTYGGDKGLWELAVLKFSGPEVDDFELTYDTPIAEDVLGNLNEKSVDLTLNSIAALPADYVPVKRPRLWDTEYEDDTP